MNVGSLFSGAGGLDEGLRRAGFRHAFMCESDEYRRGVLREQFPGVPIYDDVRLIGAGLLERGADSGDARNGWLRDSRAHIDLLAGGVPCQDWSVAGRRAGIGGERSGLFFEFARVADALRPAWLLFENVPGLFSSCACPRCQNGDGVLPHHRGTDFAVVLTTLANVGYSLAWRVLDSRFFGVPQRRRRVYIVGALADGDPRAAAERAGQVLAVGSRCGRHPATRGEARQDVAYALADGSGNRTGSGRDGQDTLIAHTLRSEGHDAGKDGSGRGTPLVVAAPLSHGSNPNSNMAGRRREDDENLVTAVHMLQDPISDSEVTPGWGKGTKTGTALIAVSQGASVRRLTPREAERLQALPDDWTNPKGDAPDSRRYAALGDAVTASVAEWIGHRIIKAGA